MARTTSDAVIGILASNYGTQDGGLTLPDLTPFIATANSVVTQMVTLGLSRIVPASWIAADLELIERWLSAHFYCVMDPLYSSKSTGGASGSFQRGPQQDGFESTDYGRAACQMDTTGTLRAIGRRQVAGAKWLGTDPCLMTRPG